MASFKGARKPTLYLLLAYFSGRERSLRWISPVARRLDTWLLAQNEQATRHSPYANFGHGGAEVNVRLLFRNLELVNNILFFA